MHQSVASSWLRTVPVAVDSVPIMQCCLVVPWAPVELSLMEADVVGETQMAHVTLTTCCWSLLEYCCVAAAMLEQDSEGWRQAESDSVLMGELSLLYWSPVESCSVQTHQEECDSVLIQLPVVSDYGTQLLVV